MYRIQRAMAGATAALKNLRGFYSRTPPTSASHAPLPEGFTLPKEDHQPGHKQAECKPMSGIPDSNLAVQTAALGTGGPSGASVPVVADGAMGPVKEATSELQLEASWPRLDWN